MHWLTAKEILEEVKNTTLSTFVKQEIKKLVEEAQQQNQMKPTIGVEEMYTLQNNLQELATLLATIMETTREAQTLATTLRGSIENLANK